MKNTLLALAFVSMVVPSYAADLPGRSPSRAVPDQTGMSTACYFGGSIGYGWLRSNADSDTGYNAALLGSHENMGNAGTTSSDGVLLSGNLGCDQSFGTWFAGGRIGGELPFVNGVGEHRGAEAYGNELLGFEQKWTISAAARLGYVVSDRTQIYALGGVAYTRFAYTDNGTDTDSPPYSYSGSSSANKLGWLLGFGLEHRLTDAISLSLEYARTDYGKKESLYQYSGDAAPRYMYRLDEASHAIKLGANYRFASW